MGRLGGLVAHDCLRQSRKSPRPSKLGLDGDWVEHQENAPDRARLNYFSNTSLICPTFFSTLPAVCSALPSSFKSASFVTLLTASLTLPFTCLLYTSDAAD